MTDERHSEALRTRDAMQALINNKGWKMLEAVFLEKEDNLLTDLLDPGQEISDEKLREMRMALINLRVDRQLPYAMLNVALDTIQQFADMNKAADDVEYTGDDREPEDGQAP